MFAIQRSAPLRSAAVRIAPSILSSSSSRSLRTSARLSHNHDDWEVKSAAFFREKKVKELAEAEAAAAAYIPVPHMTVTHPHPSGPLPAAYFAPAAAATPDHPAAPRTPPTHFAIFRHRNQQFKVVEDDLVMMDRLPHAVGTVLTLSEVLLLGGRDATMIGRPAIDGAAVIAQVEEHTQTAKVIVFKKKRRKTFKRKQGHRDQVSMIRIQKILFPQGAEPLTLGAPVEFFTPAAASSSSTSAAATPRTINPSGARSFSTLARRPSNFLTALRRHFHTASPRYTAAAATAASSTNESTISSLLKSELKASVLDIEDTSGGCGAFFRLLVVSPSFTGLSLVKQHRLVNQTLKPHIANLHGLTLTTFTEEQWKTEGKRFNIKPH